MKRFTKILESLTERMNIDSELEDLQTELIEMVEESTNTDDIELQIETINSYIEDSDTTIIGLVNDSDIFDFYLKHRNQLDIVLTEIDHFNVLPTKIGVSTSVYDYLVESTKIAIQETFKKMV
jgi:hypothetical protein